ncbi:hypothetical protein [Riemerella anatipestifer]|uniref:hypothetical protein n=1 Tax=Riemerella anatipestifer TaxID=34085 RepID=UPI0024DF7726|nr:hypothetical protein [Riemerella anatipestifer]WFS32409.1 hypothetical protein D1Y77_007795 [Riemerella anatipestifer]
MLEFIAGATIGAAGGYLAKDKLSGNSDAQKIEDLRHSLERTISENKEQKDRIKTLKEQLEEQEQNFIRMRKKFMKMKMM